MIFLKKGLFCHFLTKWECIFRMGQNLIEVGGRGLTLMFDLYILIVKICAKAQMNMFCVVKNK